MDILSQSRGFSLHLNLPTALSFLFFFHFHVGIVCPLMAFNTEITHRTSRFIETLFTDGLSTTLASQVCFSTANSSAWKRHYTVHRGLPSWVACRSCTTFHIWNLTRAT